MNNFHADRQKPSTQPLPVTVDTTPALQETREPPPSVWELLRIWALIGLQSFGGGSSTLLLIQREFTERHRWLTIEEFARDWNLCIMTPGINLVAITVLIGRKLAGSWGVLVSLLGLLLPSAAITTLIAAGFQEIQHLAFVDAMFRGVVPATAGIMLVVAINFARPLLKQGYQEGIGMLLLSLAFIALVTLALIVGKIAVVFVVVASALAGRLLFVRAPSLATAEQQSDNKEQP
ncbi:MAG: chromate transporter [Thermogemmatispora sp.]|uniref:chromate transporter n=1 Tax=Thermogemmatispora sp. TaxID=1968838 RepID=UPI0026127F0D|nr:chromate transporter [Thermogemmatispora sp.]MBX5455358.1 chromate transporter [Thermogemmatispora sp.]